jgi:hypothetical protein
MRNLTSTTVFEGQKQFSAGQFPTSTFAMNVSQIYDDANEPVEENRPGQRGRPPEAAY